MPNLNRKVAVVTGASAGIGAAIVKRLVEEGMTVVGLARRPEIIKEQALNLSNRPGKLYAIKVDLTIEEDISKAFKWITTNLGPLHLLVNNAGIVLKTTLIDGNAEMWKKTFDTNVLGPSICTREAINIMQKYKIDGDVLFINDTGGHNIFYYSEFNVYGATKYATTNLVEFWRRELMEKKSKIRVTDISPGVVKTDFMKVLGPESDAWHKTSPALLTEDLADAVIYAITRPRHMQVYRMILKPLGEEFL